MNRKLYWTVLLNPIVLAVYGLWLSILYRFCYYGGVRRRVPILIALGIAGLFWIVGWTLFYFIRRKKTTDPTGETAPVTSRRHKLLWPVLLIEIVLAIAVTGFYGIQIAQTAQPFSGKLGDFIWEKENSRTIALVHDNFKQDGLDGILSDLDEELSLPKSLYVANYISVNYQPNGSITGIYAFLYGKDTDGATRTYLVDFDAAKSAKMTVWLDGNANGTYQPSEELDNMKQTTTQQADGSYQTKWKPDDALVQAETEAQKAQETHESGDFFTDDAGGLHFFLDANTEYTLTVTDAAAGSRAYAFSGNGVTNDDPCQGNTGVAEELHFTDALHGWIVLNSPSGDNPRKYVTEDGGKTFTLTK